MFANLSNSTEPSPIYTYVVVHVRLLSHSAREPVDTLVRNARMSVRRPDDRMIHVLEVELDDLELCQSVRRYS
jgi:hypothetical protein